MAAQLIFNVDGQTITRLDDFRVVAKSDNYLRAQFTFTADWGSGTKTAQFVNSKDPDSVPYEAILDENGECEVPWEAHQYDNSIMTATVFDGTRITTNAVEILVRETGYRGDAGHSTPNPDVYQQILDRLDDVEQTVADKATEAESWAVGGTDTRTGEDTDNAKYYAEQAGTKATEAATSATQAAGSATAASGSATEAATSASTASRKARDAAATKEAIDGIYANVQTSESNARTAASAAEQSAREAKQTGETVESRVADAERSASSAAQAATDAQTSAEDAAEAAGSIGDAVSEARTYASRAENSASNASTSASSASRYSEVAQNAARTANGYASDASNAAGDANGYAGAALQSKNAAETAQGIAETAATDATTAKTAAETAAASVTQSAAQIAQNTSDITDLKDNLNDKADVIISTASGSIAHFEDGAEAYAKSVIAHIEPVQEGSGAPSPDNVRPITGHTEMNVVRTGKNLIANKKVKLENNIYLGTDIIGSPNQNYTLSINLPVGTYTLNIETADDSNTNIYVAETGIANAFARVTNTKSLTFTLTKTTACRMWVYKSDYSSIGVGAIKQFSLERGSTATDYEPYQGTTTPISWQTEAGTVYGGYVDVTRGKLVVDRAEVDLGTLNWQYDTLASIPNFWAYGFGPSVAPVINNNTKGNIICSEYETITANEGYTGAKQKGICLNTALRFFAYDQTYTSASTFKTAVSGVQLVYELANPITYDLTPTQITTLLGTNNIWNDCNGNTDVEYKADTKLYIEQLTKPTEDDMTANANIASGKFFMVGNRLFLSTSAIASGDTINPGTNCTELSLADALNNLN